MENPVSWSCGPRGREVRVTGGVGWGGRALLKSPLHSTCQRTWWRRHRALGLRGPVLGSQSSARWLRAQGHVSWGRRGAESSARPSVASTWRDCGQLPARRMPCPGPCPWLGGFQRQHSLWVRRKSPCSFRLWCWAHHSQTLPSVCLSMYHSYANSGQFFGRTAEWQASGSWVNVSPLRGPRWLLTSAHSVSGG